MLAHSCPVQILLGMNKGIARQTGGFTNEKPSPFRIHHLQPIHSRIVHSDELQFIKTFGRYILMPVACCHHPHMDRPRILGQPPAGLADP